MLFPSLENDKEDLVTARKLYIRHNRRGPNFMTFRGDLFFGIGSILEVGAFYSLAIKDVKAFERYEAMLSVYYRDLR